MTMIRPYFLLILFGLFACAFSCSEKARSNEDCSNTANPDTLQLPATVMKGWEVYSWPACGDWNYAVLYGSNALKNYDEVTGVRISPGFVLRVWGKDKVKTFLSRVPAGQSVSMIGEGWLQNTWGTGTYGNLKLPPPAVLVELQQTAVQYGVTWEVIH